ncbi:sigma-54-dependent transcriptional regulator FlbD [Magnetospirillum molischianum]|uniref:Two-component flagellar sigma 54 dependent response transcriptional regulator, Fis family n=1 Tax=Magnetospirillum molischianum DSM 120 TaxID=1150626 RepID=H8FUB5_MAGML|nr:sigma-54 dependent transcriptional regulator [Magnetospirillum molischianum]CCG41953.1 Two-component flagellar sigma 54 dependent response transcriptional regulator, Fis family [Magnetospirillum molischianum DSM 120]
MRLLIIGTLDGQIGAASQIAMARGAKVRHVVTLEAGLEELRGQGADLVMIDVKCDIRTLIDSLEAERIVVPVVACGIATDASAAVRAIKAGAKEYIPLPPDAELIAAVIAAVTQESHNIVFKDPRMSQTLKLAEQVANSDASIMITGESGTGKELVARFIHKKSRRADKRFVAVNCAAIPENLLESELFGHEKGAFTGAVARRIGKFEEANGGTLLLDEISEMDVRLQSKLLRVLQEKEIDRVGGSQPVKVDVRILATSNRQMEEEVRKGTFREDLYYRLNVVTLALPSLRERPLDITVLADHFIKRYSEANGLPYRALSAEGRQMLIRHSWRGNVRELENCMHRAVLLAQGSEIGAEAILLSGGPVGTNPDPVVAQATAAAASVTAVSPTGLVGKTVAEVERDLILDTLNAYLGNRTHAANILGISIRTLRNKLKQYADDGVPVPPPAGGEPDRAAL